jgi:hypothetical protein
MLAKTFFTTTEMGKKDTDVADFCDEWIESNFWCLLAVAIIL